MAPTRVWMHLDTYPQPEGGPSMLNRVDMSPTPPNIDAYPPNPLRSTDWEMRVGVVDDGDLRRLLAGEMTPEEQDEFHRQAWLSAGGTDVWQPSR